MAGLQIRGSTHIEELLERYPDGQALAVMGLLGWPCAHCSARHGEAIALAAKRHGNPVKAVLTCFRALEKGGPSDEQVAAAQKVQKRSKDPLDAWLRSAKGENA